MNPVIRTISIPAALLVAVSLVSSPAVAQEHGKSDGDMDGKHQMHGQAEGGMQGMGGGMLGGVSAKEKEALLKGAGLGAGMIAMMNGYPGPKHVLEMGDELELTADQRESIGTIYGNVKAESVKYGTELVEKDEALTALFMSGSVSTGEVEKLSREIGELQGRVRAEHLNAHVETFEALTPAQREKLSSMQGMHQMHQGSGEGMQKRSRQGQTSGT
jgi:Spy/CpxP family protein refolding chaperone